MQGEKFFKPEEKMGVALAQGYPDTAETLALTKVLMRLMPWMMQLMMQLMMRLLRFRPLTGRARTHQGALKEQLGSDTREDMEVVSREEVMAWAAAMDKAKSPPSGIDKELFGERDSFKRLLLESVSQGLVKN